MGIGGASFDLLCWLLWVALLRCKEQQDYKSAKKIMHMAFTFYHKPNTREGLDNGDITAITTDTEEPEKEGSKGPEETKKEDFFTQYLPEEPNPEQEKEKEVKEEEEVKSVPEYYAYKALKEAPIWEESEFWAVAFYGNF